MQFTKIFIGKSAVGHDIIGHVNQVNASHYIYLMAGVHGDEPEGVFVLNQLFNWLQEQKLSNPIMVLPLINPDGLATHTRVNGHNVDLNRNWPTSDWTSLYSEARYFPGDRPLSEPENIGLSKLFVQYKPQIIISFHSWKPMLNYNRLAQRAAEYIAQYNKYIIADNIGYPTPGSLGTYVDEVLQCGIITYELPIKSLDNSLEQIWLSNATGLRNFFLNYLELNQVKQ